MHEPDPRQRWVSVREAAIHFGTSESDIRRRIKRGELESESIPRPGGTLLRVRLPTPADEPEPSQSPPEPRQDAPEAIQAAVSGLTAVLTDERTERQRLTAENADLRERVGRAEASVELERQLRQQADEAARIEQERRLEAEQELERLRNRRWWKWW